MSERPTSPRSSDDEYQAALYQDRMRYGKRGESYDGDVLEFEELLRITRMLNTTHPSYSEIELAALVAKMLDDRNGNSPSTNGLLAIALVRYARKA